MLRNTLQILGILMLSMIPVLSYEVNKPKMVHPKKIVIAFDLDETVITGREDSYEMWFALHQEYYTAFNEAKIKYKLYDTIETVDAMIMNALDKEEHMFLKELRQSLLTGTLIPGTVEIIKVLREQGYIIVPATNMGKKTYLTLLNQKVLPEDYFTKGFFFAVTKKCNKKEDGTYHKKPEKEFFENLKSYIRKKCDFEFETIVFIDDKQANAHGAREAGIIGLHFTSPAQLKVDLENLGFIL